MIFLLSKRLVMGEALLDEWFLPEEWSADRARCQQAGINEGVVHPPKTELAREMVLRAVDADIPARWVISADLMNNILNNK